MKTIYCKSDLENETKRRELVERMNKFVKDTDVGVNALLRSDWMFPEDSPTFHVRCFVLKERATITEVEGGIIERSIKVGPSEYFVSAYDGKAFRDVITLNDVDSIEVNEKSVKFTANVAVEEAVPTLNSNRMTLTERREQHEFELTFEH